jgi:hypothetical protein
MITNKGFEVGSTVEYSCDEGHLLVGPSQRTCLETGFYNEFPPVCKFIECGLPASIPHGNYELVNGSVGYLSQVVYKCNDGFEMLGRAMLTCDIDERWNGPPPRCEVIECDALPVTYKNAKVVTSNGTFFGAKAEIQCPNGYTVDGPKFITCLATGHWSAPLPECKQDEDIKPAISTPASIPVTQFTRTRTPSRRPSSVITSRPSSRYTTPVTIPTITTTTTPRPKVISVTIESEEDDIVIPGTVREDFPPKKTIRPSVLIPKTPSITTKQTTATPKFRPTIYETTTTEKDAPDVHPQDNEIASDVNIRYIFLINFKPR